MLIDKHRLLTKEALYIFFKMCSEGAIILSQFVRVLRAKNIIVPLL